MPETERISFAQTVNESNLPWKAYAYTQVEMEALESMESAGRPGGFTFAQLRSNQFGVGEDFEAALHEA